MKKSQKGGRKRLFLKQGSIGEFTETGKGVTSKTLYPEAYNNENICQYFLCDTQGFGDSRGKEEPIVSSVLLEMVVNVARSVKVVIPFSESQLQEAGRGIRDFCCVMDKLFVTRSIDVLFIYNPRSVDFELEGANNDIKDLLQAERNRLQHLGEEAGVSPLMVKRLIIKAFTFFPYGRKKETDPVDNDVQQSLSETAPYEEEVGEEFEAFEDSPSIKRQLDKIDSLWLLEKMRRKSNEIVYIDVCSTEGRKKFYDAIESVETVCKDHFRFGKLTGDRPTFDSLVASLLNDFTKLLEVRNNLGRYVSYCDKRFYHVQNFLSYIDSKKDETTRIIESGQFPEEIIDRLKVIDESKQEMIHTLGIMKSQIKTKEVSIADYLGKIESIDTDEFLVHQTHPFHKQWGVLFQWWREYEWEYNGLNFDEFRECLEPKTTRSFLNINQEKTLLKVKYVSDYRNDCRGLIELLIKSRNHPTTKVLVANYRRKIDILKIEIKEGEENLKKIEHDLEVLEKTSSQEQEKGKPLLTREIELAEIKYKSASENLKKLSSFLDVHKKIEEM
ncbi:MAG: hypothetical protein FADNKDHG_01117 [Holosporales bacterium]